MSVGGCNVGGMSERAPYAYDPSWPHIDHDTPIAVKLADGQIVDAGIFGDIGKPNPLERATKTVDTIIAACEGIASA